MQINDRAGLIDDARVFRQQARRERGEHFLLWKTAGEKDIFDVFIFQAANNFEGSPDFGNGERGQTKRGNIVRDV